MGKYDWVRDEDFTDGHNIQKYINLISDYSYKIVISKPQGSKLWIVVIIKKSKKIIQKKFKTKALALKYAKTYMRKH